MPLTPEDVRNKLFTTVRLREGYDQTEVDEFLDEVEAELIRLHKDNDDLREKLAAVGRGEPVDVEAPAAADDSVAPAAAEAPEPGREEPASTEVVAAPTAPAARSEPQQIILRTAEEVPEGAARLLAMAQRTADATVAEARTDADRMLAEAREGSERLAADAKGKADQLDRETRARSAALDTELAEQRRTVLSKLEEERHRLAAEVETLKAFEREYRGRLKSFLEGQLEKLATGDSDDTPLAPSGPPRTEAVSPGPADEDTGSQSALGRILAEEEGRDRDQ